MSQSAKIISDMAHAAPPHTAALDDAQLIRLHELTGKLAAVKTDAEAEYARFLSIKQRSLGLSKAQLRGRLGGATVLVTGGTGCIGSTLMAQLMKYHPQHLISVSRHVTKKWPRQDNAVYMVGDVTNLASITSIVNTVHPDVIFHVAAQRSPALAELQVHRTISTNTLGAKNVLAVAAATGVPHVVMASTGKALRPYSPEVYTASKRAAECVAAWATVNTDTTVSAARFTHVIDNSIVHERLLSWARRGEALRLHSASIDFYVQSALESAQLLLAAYLGAVPGEFRVHAISDLGWPVSLLDVALGVTIADNCASPIYISGYDPGYEEVPFPGLYDPETAGDISPLINAFEAAALVDSPCSGVDAFKLEVAETSESSQCLADVVSACRRPSCRDGVFPALDRLSWSMLDATLAAASPTALSRAMKMVNKHEETMKPVHRRITEAIRNHTFHDTMR